MIIYWKSNNFIIKASSQMERLPDQFFSTLVGKVNGFIGEGYETGLVQIIQILLNPGDIALVPDPGYPDYWSGIALAGAEMVPMPLDYSNGYNII